MKPLSLTTRISLLFAGAVIVVLLATGFILTQAMEAHFLEADRHELEGKMELIRHLLVRADSEAAFDALPQQLEDALVGHRGLAVAVADTAGNIWFATSGSGFPHALLQRGQDASAGLWQWVQGGRSYRGLAMGVRAGTGEFQTVAVALDMADHEAFMAKFRHMLAMAMALAVLATAGLGWIATRRGLSPLRRVAEMAASISAERLGTRLQSNVVPAELSALVAAFNAMLARLDQAFQRLSDFSSDIAHELRTPVSNLMTQTQVALSRARDANEYRDILHSNLEEYERLARMIGDMLFLAKADNRLIVPKREWITLAEEAGSLIEFYGILAEDRNIRLQVVGNARTEGDRIMLGRALSNLLSNAIRHCPPGGTVTVRLENDVSGTRLSVENPGTIPAENLPRLFDRFFTGDPARRPGGDGVGLGLAIVKSIVAAHGGTITAHSDNGLTRFVIHLPPQEPVGLEES
jgi:two-component system heavy metal sensor histidine kinase CusS